MAFLQSFSAGLALISLASLLTQGLGRARSGLHVFTYDSSLLNPALRDIPHLERLLAMSGPTSPSCKPSAQAELRWFSLLRSIGSFTFNSMYVMWSGIDHSSSGWHVINLRKKKKYGKGQKAWGGGGEKKAEERDCFPRTQKQTGVGRAGKAGSYGSLGQSVQLFILEMSFCLLQAMVGRPQSERKTKWEGCGKSREGVRVPLTNSRSHVQ